MFGNFAIKSYRQTFFAGNATVRRQGCTLCFKNPLVLAEIVVQYNVHNIGTSNITTPHLLLSLAL